MPQVDLGAGLRDVLCSAFDDVADDANRLGPFALDRHMIEQQRTFAESQANRRLGACGALELADGFFR